VGFMVLEFILYYVIWVRQKKIHYGSISDIQRITHG
jgi:hypothetical protein